MKKKILSLGVLSVLALPAVAFAAVTTLTYFDSFLTNFGSLLTKVPAILVAIAVIYFLWGVIKFVASGDEEEARKAGRDRMIHGVIAIAVMVSIWGLVAFLQKVTGIDKGGVIKIPTAINTVDIINSANS
ncbi:hypothetical protein KJ973_02150 [Patescibacteria group bacterium]|nr:hypothetical protein [Patescibacteria group bacterium]MBU1246571.1 hypothetical protein [Patescibacteria group bacterium]MBU1519470.1 hypothetical protein [Patescibacteria group bacterium]MBU1730560.1 hypothetical protein [Patescibacteria group bacterium]MBU1956321.1 hypothetical protein [Patescibacteria group bacterium]